MKKIEFVSGVAGSGKSYQAVCVDAVEKALCGERVLVAMPTRGLIAEHLRAITTKHPDLPVSVITGSDDQPDRKVTSELVRKLNQPSIGGELVLCTHQGLLRLPHLGRKLEDWFLVIDEVPQIHGFSDLLIDDDVLWLIQHCASHESPVCPGYTVFGLRKNPKRLFGASSAGVQRAKVEQLAWQMYASHTLVHLSPASIEALGSLNPHGKKLHAFSCVTPGLVEPFGSVQLLSANFKTTLLHRLWGKFGVRFIESKEIADRLRYHQHDGSTTTIPYLSNRDWSRKLQGKDLAGESLHSTVVNKVADYFGDKPFLWVANKRHGDDLFTHCPNAQKLPNVSHGLNGFQDFDNIVHLSALNPSTPEFAYFKAMGISSEQAKNAFFHESVYQSVLRCSLRSQPVSRAVTVIVMDMATAEYLHQLLPGSAVTKLNWVADEDLAAGKAGRPKVHANATERKRASRSRIRAAKEHDVFMAACHNLLTRPDDPVACHEISIRYNTNNVTEWFWGSQFQHNKAKIACDLFLYEKLDSFVSHLRSLSHQTVNQKDDRYLISPAYFNLEKHADKDRGNENVEFNRGIWLDHDGGRLTPDAFPKLFPQLKIVIFNTFSSTKEKPRYRVFIPTTTVFSPHTHLTIMNEIWRRLEARVGPDHGFDPSAKPVSHLFYLPCQAKDPSGNIWLDLTQEEGRKLLDPREWIRKYHVEPKSDAYLLEGHDMPVEEVDWLMIERAKMRWRNLPHEKGGIGNRNFFKLGMALNGAGLSGAALKSELWQEAAYARNPQERRDQIESVLRSASIYLSKHKAQYAA